MTKLRPCPFCGGQAEIQVHEFCELQNTYGVKCRNCDAQTGQFYLSEGHAITLWNIRVTSAGSYDLRNEEGGAGTT